ncbi:hypothetical protein MRY87_03160 [bacterium]|nr:hypothetical protein [bacterium]
MALHRNRQHHRHRELGAVIPEYAVTFLMLAPIVAAAALLYFWDGDNSTGAIVDRGNTSVKPTTSMSPTQSKYCTGTEEVTPEFCY